MVTLQPLLDRVRLTARLPTETLQRYLPSYLWEPLEIAGGPLTVTWFRTVQLFLHAAIWVVLHPRRGPMGALDAAEVEQVYTREAPTYDVKHHLTTHGMDTSWRRSAAWALLQSAGECHRRFRILDLCTGTGLTVVELVRVFRAWGRGAEVIGVDCNDAMLRAAEARALNDPDIRVTFVRGDATDLVAGASKAGSDRFVQFRPLSFDAVSMVFGIGGIQDAFPVFLKILQLIEERGRLVLIDMHLPLPGQPGEWFFLHRWWRFPRLEAYTYKKTTIPLALRRLWGWRDPTLDFYLVPLVTWQDEAGAVWGFRVCRFEVESERWWLGLPFMPVGRLVAEKIRLTEGEVLERANVLQAFREATARS